MTRKRMLNSPVLVLNKNWVPIGTTSVKDALVDISRGSAKGLCVETYQVFDWEGWVSEEGPPKVSGYIKAAGGREIPAPEVIVLTNYDSIHKKTLYVCSKNVFTRDKFICQYCKKRASGKELSIDHIVPRSRGGRNDWSNCVTACKPCNQKKADKTLREAGLPPFNPKPGKPKWSPVMHISPESRLDSWKVLVK